MITNFFFIKLAAKWNQIGFIFSVFILGYFLIQIPWSRSKVSDVTKYFINFKITFQAENRVDFRIQTNMGLS